MTDNQDEPSLVKRFRGLRGSSVRYSIETDDEQIRELLAAFDSPKPAAKAEPLTYLTCSTCGHQESVPFAVGDACPMCKTRMTCDACGAGSKP
jgi:hypothetical protein